MIFKRKIVENVVKSRLNVAEGYTLRKLVVLASGGLLVARSNCYKAKLVINHKWGGVKSGYRLIRSNLRLQRGVTPTWEGKWRRDIVKLALRKQWRLSKSAFGSTRRCIKYVSVHNPYMFWYNRSTRRRARKRAKKRYREIVKSKQVLDYDTVEERLFSAEASEDPPLEHVGGTECETDVDDKTSKTNETPKTDSDEGSSVASDKHRSNKRTRKGKLVGDGVDKNVKTAVEKIHIKEQGKSVPKTDKSPVIKYARGERARELAAAAELKYGNMVNSEANREIVRRFMSGHELVKDFSVRLTDQASIIRKSMYYYFILVEDDLVDHYTINNKKNTKRHNQRAKASC